MSVQPGEAASYGKERPRKASDFQDDIQRRGAEAVERDLALPNLDQILKDLQSRHGVRISLSPQMVERLEAIKVSGRGAQGGDSDGGQVPSDASVLCPTSDICILCDQNDRCDTCDAMDWCWSVDTH